MKAACIQKLVENYDLETLKKAEEAIGCEEECFIDVEGDDEGEKLTHVLAAMWVQQTMKEQNCDYRTALRQYMAKVRESIN